MDNFNSSTLTKTLVLIGGGHAHALCLRGIMMRRPPGLRLVLVSDVTHAPYSGMLPGLIAGYYTFDETHIDLVRLAQVAGAEFVLGQSSGLDLKNQAVLFEERQPLAFDLLSINIGSTPSRIGVPGADEFAIPAKPVAQLLRVWESVLTLKNSGKLIQINIVGGGAGGVELALSMRQRLGPFISITLLNQAPEIMATHNAKVRRILRSILRVKNIAVRSSTKIIRVLSNKVIAEDGSEHPCTHTFWVTTAAPQHWIRKSGLAVDDDGFVKVNSFLQSTSDKFVFAAGDIASLVGAQIPKSGVFAVKQAKPLLHNLIASLEGEELIPYHPQRFYLSLIGTGDQSAVASWDGLAWHSKVLWLIKERIDLQFMRKFAAYP